MKNSIQTSNAPSAKAFLSQAIKVNNFIFVSGQIHNHVDGTLKGETTEEKLSQIMGNIKAILQAANADINDIVKVTIYVTDISLVPEINNFYPSYFTEPFPAREAICVKALPLGASIEISVIAVKEDSK